MIIFIMRGYMKRGIKEWKINIFGSRLSYSAYAANKFRILWFAISYAYRNEICHIIHEESEQMSYYRMVRVKLTKVALTLWKTPKNYIYK